MTLFLIINISLLDNKDKKTKRNIIGTKFKLVLTMYFIKNLIYKITKIIIIRINSWFYYKYFGFLSKFK